VVLPIRPPISIPRTTVAPALLEELLGELSSLASVYHKPAETFIGRGRIGADSVQKRKEWVFMVTFWFRVCELLWFADWQTTDFRRKRRSRPSLLVNKRRICLTLTISLPQRVSHRVWRPHKSLHPHRPPRIFSRARPIIRLTTWYLSLGVAAAGLGDFL
jgi:hypothetical protein